ncbi:MAG: DNA polymerase III subunit beta [Thiotrichales bacterium]|jgi:DNA polymerase-3 subunit beta|nr:DNA polymerase III subunit beta [Thiotrichales bacterium]
MNFTIDRTPLFNALKSIVGVVERKNTQPILSNVLFAIQGNNLTLTATNIEMEVKVALENVVSATQHGAVTLPARKVFDLISTLADGTQLQFEVEAHQAIMKVGRSRYKLSALDASDFPIIDVSNQEASVSVPQAVLAKMIKQVEFAMAQQDVRYYLNGMLVELDGDQLNLVATDGHRLAKASTQLAKNSSEKTQLIVPRRTVIELAKALGESGEVTIGLAKNHLTLCLSNLTMTVKLIEGKFPEYQRVIPVNMPYLLAADRNQLLAALARVAILANDKLRGVRMTVAKDSIELTTTNPEQDEADEFVEANFNGETFVTGYNLRYLQEALGAMPTENVFLALKDSNAACLAEYTLDNDSIKISQVIMPMRL